MSTQKKTSGRRASQDQCDLAREVLDRFDQTHDVAVLTEALEHFSKTGDFTPFGVLDQNLQKRAKFYRLRMQVKQLRGKAKDDFIGRIAFKEGMTEESVKRMLDAESVTNSTLQGSDRLYYFLEQQLKENPI